MKCLYPSLVALLHLLSLPTLQGAGTSSPPPSIPFSQLGAKATADYQGEAIGIQSSPDGARLYTGFQKLSGTATPEGLWLTSTEAEGGRLRLIATAIGKDILSSLASSGTVITRDKTVAFTRPGLVEEYSVSVDGVRQDFLVLARPAGTGELNVVLDVTGASAAAAATGVKLTLDGSGRELAYSRLHVTDASGRELAAKMVATHAHQIRITVEDANAAYPVRIDPTFSDADWVSMNSGVPGSNAKLNAVAIDAGGNIYIGGNFTSVGSVAAKHIAQWNGSKWLALGTGMDGQVLALVTSGNDLYAGGTFITAGGAFVSCIAKWNGTAWSNLGSGASSWVYALATNGTDVYAGGIFFQAGGITVNRIAKWNGSAWSALGVGVDNDVRAVAVNGANVYVGGGFTTAGGASAAHVAKWNGNSWSTMGLGVNGNVNALATSGSDVYAGGTFSTAGGAAASNIARWNGSSWSALGSGATNGVNAIAVSGTDVYAGGGFTTAGGVSAARIAKWNGTAWSALGTGMTDSVFALAVSGPTVYAGGTFVSAGGGIVNNIGQWNGSAWSPIGTGGMDGDVQTLAVSGSNLYIGGTFTLAGGLVANRIAKWNGSAWSTLGLGMNATVSTLAVNGADVYAGGYFTTAGGVAANSIAKWNGTSWSALGSGLEAAPRALALDGTDLYAGGEFVTAGGLPADHIAKWNGTAWSALGSGTSDNVIALVMSSGTLYAGGAFATAGGTTVNGISKWNGSVWSALGSGVDGNVNTLLMIGGVLHVGGSFTTAGGAPAGNIAKWSGTAWSTFGTGTNDSVNALALSANELYAAGAFTSAGGVSANRIAKWNGLAWVALGSGLDNTVTALASDAANHLFIGGIFSQAGATLSPFLVQAPLPDGPEIAVEQPVGTDLADAGTKTFGNVAVGSSTNLTFTIKSLGNASLTGLTITKDGTHATDFTITASPTAPQVPGGATTFTVQFTPGAVGARTAAIHIASNDTDENPFDLTLTGTGTQSEIAVEQPLGTDIADAGSKSFGSVNVGGNTSLIFTIKNTGNVNLTGLTITKDGTHATDFTITVNPTAPVVASGTTTFTVMFIPSAPGSRSAAIHIASNDSDENPFDITLTGTGIQPEIAVEQPVGTDIADASSKSFGGVNLGSNTSLTFTIKNTGTANLTGLTITKDGANTGDFIVTTAPVAPVVAGGATTFAVQFAPLAVGARTAAIHIANNDGDENPFDITLTGTGLAPEIAVEQPVGTNIPDAGSKSFASTNIGSVSSLTFTVKNTGGADLTGLTITKDGANPSEFTITAGATAPVGPGGSTTLTIQFAPAALGSRTAAIHIASNDSDENPFDITLTGTGLAPEIAVEQPVGTNIADAGSKSFGSVNLGSNTSLTFTVKNTGNIDLTGLTITKDGSHAADFTLTSIPGSPVTASGSTTFSVQFAPSVTGTRTAAIHIASNDGDENPFDITLTGIGIEPEISIEQPANVNIPDAGSKSFGSVILGSNVSLTFAIRNTGTANLTGLTITKDGDNATDFTITTSPTSPVIPNSATTFTVQFTPAALGNRTAAIHIASNDANENPFDITLTGTGIQAEIVVEQPLGTGIIDAGSRNFGEIVMGSSSSLTFTIKNTGTSNLTGLSLTSDGDHPADFNVAIAPAPSVTPGSSTLFVIRFTPSNVGVRTAFLHIASNDADESPFDLIVTGAGMPSPISFGDAIYSVNQGASEVTVTLSRTNGSLAASVTLNTDDGTSSKMPPFAAALAGFDYTDLRGADTLVSFAAGQTVSNIQIPLIADTNANTPNKRFLATLSNPDAHAALGLTSTAHIQILANDTANPTLTVTSPDVPLSGGPINLSRASPYLVQGIAGDAKGIDRVEVKLNGGEPVAAMLGDATIPTSVPFSLPIAPTPGANTIDVTAFDLRGNATTVTRTFNFVRRYILTLTRDAPTTAPDASGALTLAATPASSATALQPAIANSSPTTSEIIPGATVKLTATSKSGFVFNQWLGLPEGANITGNIASFPMPDSDLSDVTAVFITSPFSPPQGETNIFSGLVHASTAYSTPASNATEGFLTGTLTATSGAFTGKLQIGGVSKSFTATFFGDGAPLFTVGAAKLDFLTFGDRTLSLWLDTTNDALFITVIKGGDLVSDGVANRACYSATNKVTQDMLNSATKGFYTYHLPAKDQVPALDPATYPQGDGFGTLRLSNTGIVSVAGTLADGAVVTASSALHHDGICPLFIPLSTPGAAPFSPKGGCLNGVLNFYAGPVHYAFSGADLLWIRPTAIGADAATRLYTNGWPNGIRVDARGSLYSTSAQVQTSLDLDPPVPAGNAELILSSGKLAQVITKRINITKNAVAKIPASDHSFTLVLRPSTGAFQGQFTPNWESPLLAKPVFKGIMIQDGSDSGGYGFFISNIKSDSDPESGHVKLQSASAR